MPNPSSVGAPARLVALDHLALLQVEGPDAGPFLHGQLTAEVTGLHQARLAAYCTAQGRALTLFLVVPVASGYLLRLPQALAPGIAKRLRMYVLRAKVDLAQKNGWTALGLLGTDASSRLGAAGIEPPALPDGVAERDGLVVIARPGALPRFEIWGLEARILALTHTLGLALSGADVWQEAEILAGIPELAPQTSELFVPQMLNLDALGGISLTKGCYPGQEIVARTHYLGRLKQRLYRASVMTPAVPLPGAPLFAPNFPGQTVGQVIAAVVVGPQIELLAVVQIESAAGGIVHLAAADGPLLQWASLPYPVPGPSG